MKATWAQGKTLQVNSDKFRKGDLLRKALIINIIYGII